MKPEVSLTISLNRSSDHCARKSNQYRTRTRSEVTTNLGGVHLVDSNDKLPHTEGEREEGVLASLPVLGDTGFEFTSSASNNENGAVSLGGTSDHVLNEVTVAGGVNDLDRKESQSDPKALRVTPQV